MQKYWLSPSSIACALTFAGVANAEDIPEWVNSGKHPKYPSTVFVVGIGTAASQNDAEANALSSISKQIQANIKAASQSTLSAVGETVNSYFHQNVEVKTEEQIQGARFSERYKGSDGNFHILATLRIADLLENRKVETRSCFSKAAAYLPEASKEKIFASPAETFKTTLGLELKYLECEKKYREYLAATALMPVVTKINEEDDELKKLDSKTAADLKLATDNLGKLTFSSNCNAKVTVHRKGEETTSNICGDFEKMLIDLGLKKSADKPSFTVDMKYMAKEKGKGMSDSLLFLTSTFDVEIIENGKGSSFYKNSLKGESGGADPSAIISKIDKKIIEKISSSFIQIFKPNGG